jgi:hypothetical protein
MSLISFPFDNINIKNRAYAEASQVNDAVGSYFRTKREISYTVPAGSRAIFCPSFSLSLDLASSPANYYEKKSVSFIDYLNPGDLVYMGVWLYANGNSPYQRYYEIFYNVNGVSRFLNTMPPTASGAVISQKSSCYYFSLEIDK